MRVFVTGASGFIGGHVAESLSRRHAVHAMARSPQSAAQVERYGATPVACDLTSVEGEHLQGCDVVVHCAAFAEDWGTRRQFEEANVGGTTRMLAAARSAAVRRFVHIGTEAALFDGHDLVGIDERYPYPQRQRFLYSETKAEAERRVLAANTPTLTTLSLRPRFVWGPRDATVLPVILQMAREGGWMWLDGGRARTSTTHVANLVAAIERALERGRGGEAYFIADDGERTYREFLTALAGTQGVELRDRSIPGAIARPLAALVEALWRVGGISRRPPLTRFAAAMMSRTVTVRTEKARTELGYAPVVGVAEGLRALVAESAGASRSQAAS